MMEVGKLLELWWMDGVWANESGLIAWATALDHNTIEVYGSRCDVRVVISNGRYGISAMPYRHILGEKETVKLYLDTLKSQVPALTAHWPQEGKEHWWLRLSLSTKQCYTITRICRAVD